MHVLSVNQAEVFNLTQNQAELKKGDVAILESHEGEQKAIRGYKGMIGRLQNEKASLEQQLADLSKPKETPEHVFTPYLPFCAGGCGAKNLNYKKSEVRCSGKDCPMHTIGLGTLAEAQKLEACPGCGKSGNVLQKMPTPEEPEEEEEEEEDGQERDDASRDE